MLKAAMLIGFIVILSGFAGGNMFILTAVIGCLVLAIWGIWQQTVVFIPEMHTGVVYRQRGQAYARFLPSGVHTIQPLTERVGALIPADPGSVNGRCENVQTIGGLPLAIEWTLAYTLNPFRIAPENQPKLARNLPQKSGQIAVKHTNNVLRHIISEYTIEALTQPGIQRQLERQVRQLVAERLAQAGFEISRVMIGAVEMPPQVTTALAEVHKRKLQAENEAQALTRLQEVVSQFSDNDMQRLIELERIHMLGQNGVTLMYTPPQDARTQKLKRSSLGDF